MIFYDFGLMIKVWNLVFDSGLHKGFFYQLNNYYILGKNSVSCPYTDVWDIERVRSNEP
jgi:hypothetical protein